MSRVFANRVFNQLWGSFNFGGDAFTRAMRGAGLPAFANGGMHTGGLRLVGERGPELEATGAARYYSAPQTQRMLNTVRGSDSGSHVHVTVGIDQESGNLTAFVDQRAVSITRAGSTEYSCHALPDQIAGYTRDPPRRG